MFVDLWILSLFSILFGICAVWNHHRGRSMGIAETLVALTAEKIIKITSDGSIASYDNPKNVSKHVGIYGLDK
jgi:hypothetical protein